MDLPLKTLKELLFLQRHIAKEMRFCENGGKTEDRGGAVERFGGCVEQRIRPIHSCCIVVWGLSRLSLGSSATCSKDDCFLSKYDAEVLNDH